PAPTATPSPVAQKGDIIGIIEKPPVGTWTGLLNNRVGSFKFIYVDVIPEETVPARRSRGSSRSKRLKPKTLHELLERINLQVRDGSHGEQWHPARAQGASIPPAGHPSSTTNASAPLPAAGEPEDGDSSEALPSPSEPKGDIPRDSGCFEGSETLDGSREEAELGGPEEQLGALSMAQS
ncbi:SAM and SH3 domain-containing protein 3, partial [Manacus vitellinus]